MIERSLWFFEPVIASESKIDPIPFREDPLPLEGRSFNPNYTNSAWLSKVYNLERALTEVLPVVSLRCFRKNAEQQRERFSERSGKWMQPEDPLN